MTKIKINRKTVRKTINLLQSWEVSEEGDSILRDLHSSIKKEEKKRKKGKIRRIGFDPSRIK